MEYEFFIISCDSSDYFYDCIENDVKYCALYPRPAYSTYWALLYRCQRELKRLCGCIEKHRRRWENLACEIEIELVRGKQILLMFL